MGLLQNIANSVPLPAAGYKGHISADLTPGASNPSKIARRGAVNALKGLGRLPFNYDPGPLESLRPKPRPKSKLRAFGEYLQECRSAIAVRSGPAGANGSGDLVIKSNTEAWDPWARTALWK